MADDLDLRRYRGITPHSTHVQNGPCPGALIDGGDPDPIGSPARQTPEELELSSGSCGFSGAHRLQ
jgi:hypothetical protein